MTQIRKNNLKPLLGCGDMFDIFGFNLRFGLNDVNFKNDTFEEFTMRFVIIEFEGAIVLRFIYLQ